MNVSMHSNARLLGACAPAGRALPRSPVGSRHFMIVRASVCVLGPQPTVLLIRCFAPPRSCCGTSRGCCHKISAKGLPMQLMGNRTPTGIQRQSHACRVPQLHMLRCASALCGPAAHMHPQCSSSIRACSAGTCSLCVVRTACMMLQQMWCCLQLEPAGSPGAPAA
jgi:hypothetical protein